MNIARGKTALLLIWITLCAANASAEPTAKDLFNDKEVLVYQIRVIDVASGDKYSIGSGFRVGESGILATNFHVVSSFVHEPEKYRLEYIASDGSPGDLELMAIDVIHDLAIVASDSINSAALMLADADLSKGERIYSMGNPQDLGMTIIEGTYNGLVEKSRYRKILFSGSLNPGMSGGPALNSRGQVIGINVSKGGEQISFLVPAEHLSELLDNLATKGAQDDLSATINAALKADQETFYSAMLDGELPSKQIDGLHFPELHESLNCWGHSEEEEDAEYEAVHQHCQSEDEVYISDAMYTGSFSYDIEVVRTDTLNRFQFYTLLSESFDHQGFSNSYDEDDVTKFECHDDLVNLHSNNWKISTCLRAYKEFVGIYDASMVMVSTDWPDRAGVIRVGGSGMSAENALALFRRIMEAATWKP